MFTSRTGPHLSNAGGTPQSCFVPVKWESVCGLAWCLPRRNRRPAQSAGAAMLVAVLSRGPPPYQAFPSLTVPHSTAWRRPPWLGHRSSCCPATEAQVGKQALSHICLSRSVSVFVVFPFFFKWCSITVAPYPPPIVSVVFSNSSTAGLLPGLHDGPSCPPSVS